MNRNYQKELEKLLLEKEEKKEIPTLFLHSCCAPCSSYVLEYLSNYFEITVFYYNPNIFPEEEYTKRVEEQKRLIEQLKTLHPIKFCAGDYRPQEFYAVSYTHLDVYKRQTVPCLELNQSAMN